MQLFVMYCWNETFEMSAKCGKFSVLLAGELQFHSADGAHCETVIRNFLLFRSVVVVVGYLNLWKNSVCHMHIHRPPPTHTHRGLILIFRFVPIRPVLSLFPVASLCFAFFCENIFFLNLFSVTFAHLRGFHILFSMTKLCSFVYYATKKC
jgi:hypothetical protein